jgi:hypothetical protein
MRTDTHSEKVKFFSIWTNNFFFLSLIWLTITWPNSFQFGQIIVGTLNNIIQLLISFPLLTVNNRLLRN